MKKRGKIQKYSTDVSASEFCNVLVLAAAMVSGWSV